MRIIAFLIMAWLALETPLQACGCGAAMCSVSPGTACGCGMPNCAPPSPPAPAGPPAKTPS